MIGLFMGFAWAGSTQGAGITLEWEVKDGVVHGTAHSPGPGWVAIGFNDRPGLAGTVLLMAAHSQGKSKVEEHVAHPPNHPPRKQGGLLSSTVAPEPGGYRFQFSWHLHSADGLQAGLAAGKPAWITLAWSQSPDFAHHSARRTQVPVTL